MDPYASELQAQSNSESSVFVTNLQWWTTDVDLQTECSHFGTVTGVRFIEDKSCGKSRGMAVVDFANPQSVQACIDGMTGRDINGRPCKVTRQHAQRPGVQSGGFPSRIANAGGGRGGMGGRGGRGGGPPPQFHHGQPPLDPGQMGWGMVPPPGGMMPPGMPPQPQHPGFRPPPPPGPPF